MQRLSLFKPRSKRGISSETLLLLVMLLWTWLLAAGVDSGRIINLAGDLGLSLPPRPEGTIAAAWGARAVLALLPSLLAARLMWPWLATA